MVKIEKKIRTDIKQYGVSPYGQCHAHSTANPGSTAQNEADYMYTKDLNSGYYTNVIGNGRNIQTALTDRGAWDVGGDWNKWTAVAVELIESHKTKDEFLKDYKIYIDFLRSSAKERGLPVELDNPNNDLGIKTHWFCTNYQPNNKSDHVDPLPYLAKWNITHDMFKEHIKNGFNDGHKEQVKPSRPALRYYTVKKGDTLYSIGIKFKIRVDELKKMNKLTSNIIKVGQVLTIADSNVPIPPKKPVESNKWYDEKATFTSSMRLPITEDYTGNGKVIGWLAKGDLAKYDKVSHVNGYVWIRQPRANGKFGYIATGESKNGQRVSWWGQFK